MTGGGRQIRTRGAASDLIWCVPQSQRLSLSDPQPTPVPAWPGVLTRPHKRPASDCKKAEVRTEVQFLTRCYRGAVVIREAGMKHAYAAASLLKLFQLSSSKLASTISGNRRNLPGERRCLAWISIASPRKIKYAKTHFF